MAHIRQRITKAGSVSTALVESYRDARGQPRQRLIANLHGESDTLRALARLAVQRDALRQQRKELASGKAFDDRTGEVIDAASANRMLAWIDERLAAIRREQAVLRKHCDATPKQMQAAIRTYKRKLDDTVKAAMGAVFVAAQHDKALKAYKAKVRRMRGG
jgi:hypothetical protein